MVCTLKSQKVCPSHKIIPKYYIVFLLFIILTVVDEVCFAATDVNTGYKLKFQHRRRKQ